MTTTYYGIQDPFIEGQFIEIALLRAGNNPSKLATKLPIPAILSVVESPTAKPEQGFGFFRFMTPKDGDKRVTWDSRDFAQISAAKQMFDEAITQGLIAYRVGFNKQPTSEIMVEFDPYAEEIVFLPLEMVAAG
jgi:hypothetical protein